MVLFLSGVIVGALLVFGLYLRKRWELEEIDEEKQFILQEKQIVIDFMHDMVEALGEGLTRRALFERIVHAAILSTGALSACVFEKMEDDSLRGVAIEGLFPPQKPLPNDLSPHLTTRARFVEQVLRSDRVLFGEGLIGQVAQQRRAEWIRDAATDSRIIRHDDRALEVKSFIAAPILFGDRLLGVLAVANAMDGLAFSETDFSLVQSLADQAGLAVNNNEFLAAQVEKKQLDVDLALARNIQRMLIPQEVPAFAGLDIDVRYFSAKEVGGDLVDCFLKEDGRLVLAVADVSGKGVAASLLMAICRTHLRHFADQFDSPADVLRAVNRAMISEMRQDMFITVLLVFISADAGELVLARAGHELPLLLRADSGTGPAVGHYVRSDGMPVGMVDQEIFAEVIEDVRQPFMAGDVMTLYTDGITEAVNPEGKEFSGSRLADSIRQMRDRPAEALNAGILEALDRFSDHAPPHDDFTLVTVKRVVL